MNYLAHLFLSGSDEGLLIGNFIADSVKGKEAVTHPLPIQKGILLHRSIDKFTDDHPLVAESKELIRAHYMKYSGVVVDIYYDHFLALQWEQYSLQTLGGFSTQVIEILKKNAAYLHHESKRFLQYAIFNNILERYAEKEGIAKVFRGMAGRARFQSGMEHAVEHLLLYENDLSAHFTSFFPQLVRFTEMEIKRLMEEGLNL